jgi:RNase P/RNase MRP subunit p30
MNRAFSDLHLRANSNDAQRLITKAANLGYSQIAIPFSAPPTNVELSVFKTFAQASGIDFVSRADFKPRTQEDLTRFLRKYRRQFEIVCILIENKDVARQAAKDHRVDILNFPCLDYKKRFFDRAEAELASNTDASFEIDVKPLLTLEGSLRTRLLSTLRRETAIAKEFHVPLLISSGVSEELLMRKPHDMASLGFLFGLKEETSLDAISSNPAAIVSRNRSKLDSKFVAPGITLQKEGTAK